MKNKFQKMLCLVLCLALVSVAVLALVACEDLPQTPTDPERPTEQQKEQIRQQLLEEVDLSRAEATMTKADSEGEVTDVYAVWDTATEARSDESVVNADVIVAQYNEENTTAVTATVIFLRGEDAYGATTELEISGSNKIAGIQDQLSTIIPILQQKTLEEWLEVLSERIDVDLSMLKGVLSVLEGGVSDKQLAAFLKDYFTNITVTNDGYVVSLNTDKLANQLWNVAYAIAAFIDANKYYTFNELYQDEEFQTALAAQNLTAAQLERLINQLIAAVNEQLPEEDRIDFVALPAQEDETASEYLGRYLVIQLENGKTVGEMTMQEVLCEISPIFLVWDVTDVMNIMKSTALAEIKKELSACKCELHFNKDKQFVGMYFEVEDELQATVTPIAEVTLTDLTA